MTLFKRELPSSTTEKKASKVDLQAAYDAVLGELRALSKTVETMGKEPSALNKLNQIFVEIGLRKSEKLAAGQTAGLAGSSAFYKNKVVDMKGQAQTPTEEKPEDHKHTKSLHGA